MILLVGDKEIGKDELLMGLNLLRWWTLRKVGGNVLEVGCGTGRNFSYYPASATVVAVDAVPDMLQQAKKKLTRELQERTTLLVMDAHKLLFPDESFDTVVDTFGLCSYEDPVTVLKGVCVLSLTDWHLW